MLNVMSIFCNVDSLVILLTFSAIFLCNFSSFITYFCLKNNKDLVLLLFFLYSIKCMDASKISSIGRTA